jgi:acyl carrier protein
VADRPQTAAVVRDALAELWPGRFDESQLREEAVLGQGGLGLDSIDIVELVLECEERAGRARFATDQVLDGEPITLGRLIDHLTAA